MNKSGRDLKQLIFYFLALFTILSTAGCLLQQYFTYSDLSLSENKYLYNQVSTTEEPPPTINESQSPPEPKNSNTTSGHSSKLSNNLTEPLQPTPKIRPRIAIIIDDMGFQKQIGHKLLDLPLNLTFSFLPYAPYTQKLEIIAYEKGRDILLHLPMEPHDKNWNPGPSALYLTTSRIKLTKTIDDYLELVPHAIGANNHMGSRFTENRRAMRNVLHILQQRGMFFIDSFTTAKTVGMSEAITMGIPTARRNVFLDNVHTRKNICHQLEELIALAKKDGTAIGIGHPNPATLSALTQCGKQLLNEVELVSAHELIGKPIVTARHMAP